MRTLLICRSNPERWRFQKDHNRSVSIELNSHITRQYQPQHYDHCQADHSENQDALSIRKCPDDPLSTCPRIDTHR